MRHLTGLLIIAIACFHASVTFAQLEYIPDVQLDVPGKTFSKGVFLINTTDNRFRFGAAPKYLSSLQVIDPQAPWPPIFFTNVEPGDVTEVDDGLIQDARFQYPAGYFSFFMKASHFTKGAYFISDTNFIIRDTFLAKGNIDGHGFEINSKGEFLYMRDMDTILNLAAYCNHKSDTAVPIRVQMIFIADQNHAVVFTWNPLHHIPFSDTRNTCYDLQSSSSFEKLWNWSHGNSLRFALDGNILYSYRHLGIGKINRKTGELMWKLGGKTPTIPVPEGAEFYEQHDFHEIAPGIYSVYSCGDEDHACRAIIFKIDERNNKAEVVNVVDPQDSLHVLGTGNYEIGEDGLCIFNYGRYACIEERQQMFEVMDTLDRVHARYSSPCLNTSFQVHHIPEWKPSRPQIINDSGTLMVKGASSGVSWYKIVGIKVILLSNETAFKPSEGGAYIATVKKGFGWIVSDTYNFR